MNRLATLIKLNIKRAIQSLFSLVIGAIALIFLVGAIAFCGINFMKSITSNTTASPINIAVVLYDDSLLASTISNVISTNEEVSESIAFDFVDEDAAINGLEKGSYIAAIVIQKDTVDSILNGTNTPIQVVFPKNSGLEAVIIKEITDAAATLLSSAQAGIYSIYDIYEEHDASSKIDGALMRMNLKYISFAASGSKLYNVHPVSSTGSMSLSAYYLCGGIVMLMMLLSINCFSFTDRLSSISSMRLSIVGTPFIFQELSSYISIIVSEILTLGISAVPAFFILKIFGINLSPESIYSLLLAMPALIIVSSGFVHLMSRLGSHTLSRIMISFIITLILCFISGCFVPQLMLPDWLIKVGMVTPTHHMFDLVSSGIGGKLDIISMLLCIVFGALLFLIGTGVSYMRRGKELR